MSADDAAGQYELRYLLVLTEPTLYQQLLDECAPFATRLVFEERAGVSVLEITSPRRYRSLSPSAHELIEADLKHMRDECRFFGHSYLEHDGNVVGQRWPVLVESDERNPTGPDVAELESSWNNLILRSTGEELAERLINVAGLCLASYYICRQLDDLTAALAKRLLNETEHPGGGGDSIEEWTRRREAGLAAQILADPRRRLYWGCERQLYEAIRTQWGLDELEASVDRSAGTLSQIVHDRTLRVSAAQNASSARAARRAAVGLLILTVISGVSALTSLIEFGVSGEQPRALVWRIIISGLLLTATVLLILLNRRALRAHAQGALADAAGSP